MATVRTPAPERDRHLAGFISRCAALDAAHQNLVVAGFRVLRNDNAHRERRFYGASAEREIVKEPVYDVKVLDRLVGRVAREVRLVDQALKATNAKTVIDGYDQDDAVLGELS
jgi:hypothetical protein